MRNLLARIDWLMGKRGSFSENRYSRRDHGRRLASQKLRMEALEDRMLLAVTAGGEASLAASALVADNLSPDTTGSEWVVNTWQDTVEDGKVSLRKALISAVDGDRITFDTSIDWSEHAITLTNGTLIVNRSITIDASENLKDGKAAVTVSGGNKYLVFSISSESVVLFDSLVITEGFQNGSEGGDYVSTYGAGICNEGTLTLRHSVVTGNNLQASQSKLSSKVNSANGAGIFSKGVLTIVDSAVTNNTVTALSRTVLAQGGGIYALGTLSVENTLFSGNKAVSSAKLSYGGAVNLGDNGELLGEAVISGSDFTENSASLGGAVYVSGSLALDSSSVYGNTSDTEIAGVICNNSGTIALISVTVRNNIGTGIGGSEKTSGTLTVKGSTIYENSYHGVYNSGAGMNIANTTISNNGYIGLWNQGDGFTMTDSAVSGNAVGFRNGADGVFLDKVTIESNENTFYRLDGSRSSGIGNAVAAGIWNTGTLQLNRSFVRGNTTTVEKGMQKSTNFGAGVYNSGTITITWSSIEKNAVSGADANYGAGIFNAGTAEISNSYITENGNFKDIKTSGAGLYNNGTAFLTNVEISKNYASVEGSAVYNFGTLTARNITVAANSSSGEAYGIYNVRDLTLTNALVVGNKVVGEAQISGEGDVVTTNCIVTADKTALKTIFAAAPAFNADGSIQNFNTVNLRLAKNSPAINAGTNAGIAADELDLDGNLRIWNAKVDIGCYEYGSQAPESNVLNTPENLTITLTEFGLNLTAAWDSVENAGSYILRWTTDWIEWQNATIEATEELEYKIPVIEGVYQYHFTIQAISDSEEYVDSLESDVVTYSLASKLPVPENLALVSETPTSVTLSWDPVYNAGGYMIRYTNDSGVTWSTQLVSPSTYRYTFTELDSDAVYTFTVTALASAGYEQSDESEPISITPGKLTTPENISAVGNIIDGNVFVTASWDANPHAQYYIVKCGSDTIGWQVVKTSDTSTTISGLALGTQYFVTVKAVAANKSGYLDSDESLPVAAEWPNWTYVTTERDVVSEVDSETSLREALRDAKDGMYILFAADLAGKTCFVSSTLGAIEITSSVVIDVSSLEGGFIVDGNKKSGCFTITNEEASVTMVGLTIQNGYVTPDDSSATVALGGGIASVGKELALYNCTVTGNTAAAQVGPSEYGNAIAYGGGVYTTGKLIMSGCSVSGNTAMAETSTSASAYRAEAIGGGVYASEMEISHCTITQNIAQAVSEVSYAITKGGGVYGSGSIVNSLINLNTAQAISSIQMKSSAVYAMSFGGGVCQGTDLTITNSTIAKNSSWASRSKDKVYYSYGGGVCALNEDGIVAINNSIVLLNNTSYIQKESDLVSYEGYDICLYTGNDKTLVGHNNISTYAAWAGESAENAVVSYGNDGSVSLYTGGQVQQFASIDNFLNAFFEDVCYSAEEEEESGVFHENYRLVSTAAWAINRGNNGLAVEADGSPILVDLDGESRVKDFVVDIGAYESEDMLTVTTYKDVIDPLDGLTSLREALIAQESLAETGVIHFAKKLAGKTITLDESLGSLLLSKSVEIDASNLTDGNGNPALTIDGVNMSDSMMKISPSASTVKLIGLNFTNGSAVSGAAVYSEAADLILENTNFSFNNAEQEGGAIYTLGNLTLNHAVFDSNSAQGAGGALAVKGNLDIQNAEFFGNSAGTAGGAAAVSGDVSVSSSRFTSNAAETDGGAVSVSGAFKAFDSSFTGNSAQRGGAVYAAGTAELRRDALSDNSAAAGGAVCFEQDALISYSVISENGAENGGAVYVGGGKTLVVNSQIDNNTADQRGGAVFLADNAVFTARNATITANTAKDGAAVYASENAKADLYNTIAAINTSEADSEIAAESGAQLNAYAVLSSFTDWTNKSDNLWLEYDPHYQLFTDMTSDGIYRLASTASQAIDLGINAEAVDENGNQLTSDILGAPRIVQSTSAVEAIVDLGAVEFQLSDIRNIQVVYSDLDEIQAMAGDDISLSVWHQVIKHYTDADAKTLVLRIHFDSSYLTFNPESTLYEKIDMTGEGNFTVYEDLEDYDGDASTDSYILVAWNNQNKLWNGAELKEIFPALSFTVSSGLASSMSHTTYVRWTVDNLTPGFQFVSTPVAVSVDRATYDIDGDGVVNLSTDANLILRYMEGKRGDELVDGLLTVSSVFDADYIEKFFEHYSSIFDIDGDGKFSAAVDGTLLVRYLAGFTGEELVSGIGFPASATRKTASAVQTYISRYMTDGEKSSLPSEYCHTILSSSSMTVVAGETFNLNFAHILTPQSEPLTGTTLSIRLYYDSSVFDADMSKAGYYLSGAVGPSGSPFILGSDTEDEDADENTDTWIQVTWNNQDGWTWSSQTITSLVSLVLTAKDISAGNSTDLAVSAVHVRGLECTANFAVADCDVNIAVVPTHFDDNLWLYDIDGSGKVDIATDGNLLLRYLIFGNTMVVDDLVVNGQSTRGTETTGGAEAIIDYLNNFSAGFDIDGDGKVRVDTDVTYLMKFLALYRGDDLQIATPSKTAVRKTGDELSAYIKRFIPEEQRVDPTPSQAELLAETDQVFSLAAEDEFLFDCDTAGVYRSAEELRQAHTERFDIF